MDNQTTHTTVVYGQPGCMQCKTTTRLLDKLGAPYTYVDVLEDTAAGDRLRAEGALSLPVVEVLEPAGNVVASWTGFREQRLRAVAHGTVDPAQLG